MGKVSIRMVGRGEREEGLGQQRASEACEGAFVLCFASFNLGANRGSAADACGTHGSLWLVEVDYDEIDAIIETDWPIE